MPKIIELTVEIDIQRVSCPGVWLCQDGRVSLTVFALGTNYQTCLLPPMFPLLFKDIFYFRKRFQESCAVNNMCCLLKEETIYCELVQWTEDCNQGDCTLLAQYLGALNDVLFPPNMCSNDGVDLLMRRAKDFPGILSPKIEIATKVRIDEIWKDDTSPPAPIKASTCQCSAKDMDNSRQRQVCHTPQYHRHKCFSAGRPQSECRPRSECSRSACSLPKDPATCRCPKSSKKTEKDTCDCPNPSRNYVCNEAPPSKKKSTKVICECSPDKRLNVDEGERQKWSRPPPCVASRLPVYQPPPPPCQPPPCRPPPCQPPYQQPPCSPRARPDRSPRRPCRQPLCPTITNLSPPPAMYPHMPTCPRMFPPINSPQHPDSPGRHSRSASRSRPTYVYNVKTGDAVWMKSKNYSVVSESTIRSTDTEKLDSPNEEKLQKILLESRYIEQEISRKRSQQKFRKIFKPQITPCVCEICKRYHELFHTVSR